MVIAYFAQKYIKFHLQTSGFEKKFPGDNYPGPLHTGWVREGKGRAEERKRMVIVLICKGRGGKEKEGEGEKGRERGGGPVGSCSKILGDRRP